MPIKGQSKTTKTITCRLFNTKNIPIGKRTWIDVEPGEYSFADYTVSKKLIHLLRDARIHREDDRAVEFWRIKDDLQKHFPHCPHWSDDRWKKSMAGGGGNKKIYQYCTDSSGTIVYFRAFQGHSRRNLIDPSLQDNVIIRSNFFQYICHVGCAFNLHWKRQEDTMYWVGARRVGARREGAQKGGANRVGGASNPPKKWGPEG